MVLIHALLACGPKAAPVAAAQPTPLDLVLVAEDQGDHAPRDVPPAAASRIGQVAADRNLLPRPITASAWSTAFASRETAAQRLAWAAEQPSAAPATLVVSVEPSYFGIVAGRYRWTVDVDLALRAGDADQAEHLRVPVLLTWDHEREDAAIDAALPLIERAVEAELDRWLVAAK
jgi:hypothetical protein